MIDYVTKTLNLPVLLFDKIIAPRCRADPATTTALLLYSSLYQLCGISLVPFTHSAEAIS